MFEKIKEFFDSKKSIRDLAKPSFKEKIKEKLVKVCDSIPGGGITVTAFVFTIISFVMGHIMAVAALAGIVMTISISCLYAGCPTQLKSAVLWTCAKFGWYLDVIVTIALTLIGFKLGATLGIVAMVLGMNLSMLMSICRWVYNKTEEGRIIEPVETVEMPGNVCAA